MGSYWSISQNQTMHTLYWAFVRLSLFSERGNIPHYRGIPLTLLLYMIMYMYLNFLVMLQVFVLHWEEMLAIHIYFSYFLSNLFNVVYIDLKYDLTLWEDASQMKWIIKCNRIKHGSPKILLYFIRELQKVKT